MGFDEVDLLWQGLEVPDESAPEGAQAPATKRVPVLPASHIMHPLLCKTL